MNCKNCGKLLPAPEPGGRRVREFCGNACKQAHYRKAHQVLADRGANEGSTEAQRRIVKLERENADLLQQIMRLQNQLDVERRYHQDIKPHGFKSWLKKQPASPLVKRLVEDELVPVRGSRSIYEAHLRKQQYSPDDMHEFAHLWKAMLLQP
jgi:hypothetical protein